MPNETGGQTPPPTPDAKSSLPSPSVQLPNQGPVTEDRTTYTEQDRSNAKKLARDVHWTQHATFWTQVGLGVIGILALGIYFAQWREQIAVRKTQASIQRPHIGPSAVKFANFADVQYLQMEWNNFGSSPARRATIDWTWQQNEPASFGEVRFKGRGVKVGPIAPHAPDLVTLQLSEADIAEMRRWGKFYIVAKVTYQDDFLPSDRKQHVNEFCAAHSELTPNGAPMNFHMSYYCAIPKLNCFDESCDDYYKLNPNEKREEEPRDESR